MQGEKSINWVRTLFSHKGSDTVDQETTQLPISHVDHKVDRIIADNPITRLEEDAKQNEKSALERGKKDRKT